MYFYIIDESTIKDKLSMRRFNQMSLRLNDLGIFNEKSKISPLNPIENIVNDVLSNNQFTHIISVGNDVAAHQTVNAIVKNKKFDRDITFGIIPIHPSSIADSLGIPDDIDEACISISRRKFEYIDLIQANNLYFLSSLDSEREISKAAKKSYLSKVATKFNKEEITEVEVALKDYKIKTRAEKVSIVNALDRYLKEEINARNLAGRINIMPNDGIANLIVSDSWNNPDSDDDISFFASTEFQISSSPKVAFIADNTQRIKTPIKIEAKHKIFKAIVGKKRDF